MPNIPKNILDLLGDIDASNPANDSVQLDDLIQHVQKSAPTPKFTKIAKQIKITPHQGTKEILKEKISFEQLDAVPEFEIEKNVGEFSHFSIREKPDFLSKITVPEKN